MSIGPKIQGTLGSAVLVIGLLALLIIVVETLRVVFLLKAGHDDPGLSAAANILLSSFVAAVAAERVINRVVGDKP